MEAMQCGYCTPGMIVSGVALAQKKRESRARQEIVQAMQGNMCRCGTYPRDRRGHASWPSKEKGSGMTPFEPERYELMAGPAYTFSFGRRGFFKALGGGIVVVSFLLAPPRRRNRAEDVAAAEAHPKQIGAWLHIDDKGAVTVVHRQGGSRPERAHFADAEPSRRNWARP